MSVIEDVTGSHRIEKIMRETWGHMDAHPGVKYRGVIVFAEGAYGGERIILQAEFGNAGYGPWFYAGIQDWLSEQETEAGHIYRFEGTYCLRRGGHHEFVGNVTEFGVQNES